MAESRVQPIIDDWRLKRAGRPRCDATLTREWGAGTWVRLSCGDDARSSLTLITAPDQAVSILALGSVEEAHAIHNRWLEAKAELTRTAHPPVLIELHGQRRTFTATPGGWLLGYVEVADQVALLGHDGESILILVGDGERFELRAALRPSEIPRVVVLDAPPKMAKQRAHRSQRRAQRSPSTAIATRSEAEHRRLLDEDPREVAEGEPMRLAVVVPVALSEIALAAELRACHLDEDDRACIARGAPHVAVILEVLREMKRNFFNTGRAIYHLFRAYDSERISMSEHDFVCALGLLDAVGTCLVARPRGKRWIVRGEGIDEADHPLHLQLCKETRRGAGREAARRLGIEGAVVTAVAAVAATPAPRAIAESSEMFGDRRGATRSRSRPRKRVRGPTLARGRRRSTSRRRSGAVADVTSFPSAGFVLMAIEAVVIDGPRVAPEIFDDVELALAAERWRNCDNTHAAEDGRRLFAAYWAARLDERTRPQSEVVVAAEADTIASTSAEIADAQPQGRSSEATAYDIGEFYVMKLRGAMARPATNGAVYHEDLDEERSDPAISTTAMAEEGDASSEAPVENHRVDVRVRTTAAPTSPGQVARAARAEAWLRAHGPGLPDLTPRASTAACERGPPPQPEPEGDSPPPGAG